MVSANLGEEIRKEVEDQRHHSHVPPKGLCLIVLTTYCRIFMGGHGWRGEEGLSEKGVGKQWGEGKGCAAI
ncbi:hypothetical protein SESBI_26425 [Sesbania bispinosa]|nr:hypothetical protein SESBI_26425 [Sesbania bispinosa]